jgi:PleD family two-component response regulator
LAHANALRQAGFTVVAVLDCEAGLSAMAEVTPHIVVANLTPRTRDECLALCGQLQGNSRTNAIPILLTAETITSDDLRRATDMKVLSVAVGPHDEAKITGAVLGVLAVSPERELVSQAEQIVGRSA